jgi:uncharacterized protein YndB with AHSA1/START domain
MTATDRPNFVYVTYIRATQAAVWTALTDPDFTEKYWSGTRLEADWRVGGKLVLLDPARGATDTGEVLAWDPPKRLAYSFHVTFDPVFAAEGASRVSLELEAQGEVVKLTLVHDRFPPDSKVLEAVSGGWPGILSSLKSLLESGEALPWGDAEAARAEASARARAG